MHESPVSLETLDAAIEQHLIGRPMPSGRRMLGLELERLILHRDTRASAPLDFCRSFLAGLVDDLGAEPYEESGVLAKMRAGRFGVSMEPGGQLELDTEPCPNLATLEKIFTEVTGCIEKRLADTPYELVALGHAPQTPVEELDLLPRPRYQIMDSAMPVRGKLTRNMMRATAGLQMTCDFVDRDDAGRRLALLNRLSPVLMSLTANSSMVAGKPSGDASYRHRVWWETDASRVGIPEGTLDAATAVDGYVRFARRAIGLFAVRDGQTVAVEPKPFEELVGAGQVTQEDLELHMTSLFPFVRLRNYIEIRCFDTVEWPLAKSVLALLSGLCYCNKATAGAEALSESFAIRNPDELRAFHLEAARSGLDSSAPDGRGFRDVARELIELAAGRLGGPDCDWAKIDDLELVRRRVEG